MHHFLSFILFLLFLSAAADAPAQEFRAFARRYGVEEGLPHRQVNGVMQDRRGFIWAATNGGVVRFDGQRFKVFNKTENGLGGDIVDWVAEDADGWIWACHTSASSWFDILDPVAGKVTPAGKFFKSQPLVSSCEFWVTSPLRMADGALLIRYEHSGSFLIYHPRRGWRQVKLSQCSNLIPLSVSTRQTIWCTFSSLESWQAQSLVELDTLGRVLRRIDPAPGCYFWDKRGETGVPGGFFLVETGVGQPVKFWEFDDKGNRKPAACYVPESPFVHQQARLDNQIEVQFPRIVDPNGNVLVDLQQQFPEIDPSQFREYIRDRNGNLWFATTFGLLVVEIRKNYFRRLLYDPQAPGGRGLACRGMLEKNGQLFVNFEAYGQHRRRVDLRTGAVTVLDGKYSVGIGAQSDGGIWTDYESSWGLLSIAQCDAAGQPAGFRLLSKGQRGSVAWSILEDSPGRLLVGSALGAVVFTKTTRPDTWELGNRYPELDGKEVLFLTPGQNGTVWACTSGGLYVLKKEGGIAARYWSGARGEFYLPYDNIYHFHEDAEGIVWLSTGGNGLVRWDRRAPAGRRIQVIFRKNGLLNGVVYAAYEDAHRHLWLPTDHGIVQFDKASLQVRRTWLMADGLTHNEFNRVAHCRGADGTLYFGGLNGVTAFHPDAFYEDEAHRNAGYTLVVSDFSVLNAQKGQLESHTAEMLSSRTITVSPDDRYLQLEFSLLEFIAPEKATYMWKLDGLSNDWETLKEPVLRLSGLPFGKQRLRIRAQAADGTWAANELDIPLYVLLPVYLRGWFLLAMAALLALGIWVWLYWRTRNHRRIQEHLQAEVGRQTATIRQQTEELKRLDESKSRFFANVSHELRTPLTLILGPLGSMLKAGRLNALDKRLAQTARTNGSQLLQLVSELLDLSKMEAGKLHLQEAPLLLQPFFRRVVGTFESHAERLGILFVYECRLSDRLRVLADEDKLQKVLNNLLSNALKFTPSHAGGLIQVRISGADGYFRIEVQDNGRGIHPDDLPFVFERFFQTKQANTPVEGGTGIGLALCREYAELMQGRTGVESSLGKGSLFYFEFPAKEVLGTGENNVGRLLPTADAESFGDAPSPRPLSVENTPAHQPARILLVEDNESLRDYLQQILSEFYVVHPTGNGRQALDFLQGAGPGRADDLPDLILSDVMMPLMDGFQLLDTLKSDARWRHIPVVMLTARAALDDRLRALRIGVDDYLLKPFEEEELLARLGNLLKNHRLRTAEAERPGSAVEEKLSVADQEWLEQLEKMATANVGDSRLSVDWLAHNLSTGRNLFYKKVKQLTGMTPNEYIQEVRLTAARQLLETGSCRSVRDAASAVGLRDVKYFSEQFKKRFGKLPSEYR